MLKRQLENGQMNENGVQQKTQSNPVSVIRSESLSRKRGDERFVVISVDTGKILDDAQGYGYKSVKKAWAAWKWKERGCPKPYVNPEIKRWFSEHKKFCDDLEYATFHYIKDMCREERETKKIPYGEIIKELLEEYGMEVPLNVSDMAKTWENS